MYPDTDPGVMQPLSSLVRVVFALLIPALLAGTQATSPALATPPGLSPPFSAARASPPLPVPRLSDVLASSSKPARALPARQFSGQRLRALWVWPLTPRPQLVNPFAPPATTYGSGHRGIDLAPTGMSDQVSAVAAGVVTHVGRIAGRGPVSVTHPGNIKSTYEPVLAGVRVGASVAAGTRLGSLEPVGSHCAPTTCLHLGALRRGSADQWLYVDPLLLLGDVEIVLLPKTR